MVVVLFFGELKGGCEKFLNVLILLMDGQQFLDLKVMFLEEVVVLLFQFGVKVFVVGVGDQFLCDELRLIVEKDCDIFIVNDFDDLFMKFYEIVCIVCDVVESKCFRGVV